MYAVINRYNDKAPNDVVCGYVYSLHLDRLHAEAAATRLLTLGKMVGGSNDICIARVFNGRHKGDSVLKTDLVVLSKFATGRMAGE